MASKNDEIVGAPTVEGSIGHGVEKTVIIYLTVTPDWPNDKKIGLGAALESGPLKPTKFDSVTLNFSDGTTYQNLQDVARYFEISSEDTETSTASRVSFYRGGRSTEEEQVAFFIIKPGVQISTAKKGFMQWYDLE